MESLIIRVDDRLAQAGDVVPCAGHLDWSSYSLGDHNFSLPQGITFDIVLTNAGEGILASGMIHAHVVGECDRCLEPAEFDIASEIDEYYLFDRTAPSEEDDSEDDEVEFSFVNDDNTICLDDAISSALLMETPYIVLCSDDCKGLCPDCGINLNLHTCNCAEEHAKEAKADNPFAVLETLVIASDEE